LGFALGGGRGVCILPRMQRFFESEEAIERFLEKLHSLICPVCGASGRIVRHGYIWGAISETEYGIRGWRILCDPDSPHGAGCGHAPAIWLTSTLLRRCFTAEGLWLFILALCSCHSVRAAWKQSGIQLSLRTGYRLFHRLNLCQSVLRTSLCSRAPPPEKTNAGSPLFQVLDHMKEAFGNNHAVSAYQETFQKDFLALA
jgi:hypothetical protein